MIEVKAKLSQSQKLFCLESIGEMLKAGLKIEESVRVLHKSENKTVREFSSYLLVELNKGKNFADVLANNSFISDHILSQSLRSCKSEGDIVRALAIFTDKISFEIDNRKKVLSYLIYPAFVLLVCIVSYTLICERIIPNILSMHYFEGKTQNLERIVKIYHVIKKNLIPMIMFAWIGVIVIRNVWQQVKDSRHIRKLYFVDFQIGFFTNVGLLIGSGYSFMSALDIVFRGNRNDKVDKEGYEEITRGSSVREILSKIDYLTPGMVEKICLAEESNNLSEAFEIERNNLIRNDKGRKIFLIKAIEPISIVLLAVLLLLLVVTVVLPYTNVINNM